MIKKLIFLFFILACLAFIAGCASDDDAPLKSLGQENDESIDDDTDDDDTVDDDDDVPDDDISDDDDDPLLPADPAKRGPFEVGNRTFVFVDESRQCPFAGGKRTLVVEVWYPATAEAASLPRNTIMDTWAGYEEEAVEALLNYGVLPSEIPNFYGETTSARDASIETAYAPYPLIVYSHGWTNYRTQNFAMSEYLASHGFIVVASDHPGDTFFTPIPGNLTYWGGGDDPFFFYRSLRLRTGDVHFLVDSFLELNGDDPNGLLTGMIDTEHIGMIGFSLGGQTVLENASNDDRVDAVASLTSSAFPGGIRDYHASLMFIFGLEDRTLGFENPLILTQYFAALPPKFMGVFPLAGHHCFSDTCLLRPSMGAGDGCGMGNHLFGGGPFEFPSYETMRAILDPYLTAFMGCILRNEQHMQTYLQENHAPETINWFFEFPNG